MTTKIPLIQNDSEQRRMVVMGGSFNPPTVAHYKLMLSAVEATGAEAGLFVPSKQSYVQRKMRRLKFRHEVLSEKTRLNMLLAMCRDDERLDADGCEYGMENRAQTFEMLEAIQAKHPRVELWFIAGSDKLSVISRWHRSEELLRHFRILIVTRDGILPSEAVADNPFLQRHADSFRLLRKPEGIEDVSSTRLRELLRNGDEGAAQLVHPAVWKMLLDEGWLKKDITSFRGNFEFLSNFYEAPIEYDGLYFGSGEAAFQAQKCVDIEERRHFQNLRPSEAKREGRKVSLRPDWEQVKVRVMEEIVWAKFTQNTELGRMLLATEDRLIQEGNTWHDTFWGVDLETREGENHLGKILMKIREKLRGPD